ncbi:TIGR04149 family rSAM-modified RiPP [Mucilaginibacter sp.]|uniref:TIGR04149 family rSAM-modified RiPP n=1 Tax=Mucilaginibacter sp. TaxID=1882438 RepID=UPI0038B2E087
MKKLSLKLTGIKQVLKKEEMKQVKGGSRSDCYNQCSSGSSCISGPCVPSSCLMYGGQPYSVCW